MNALNLDQDYMFEVNIPKRDQFYFQLDGNKNLIKLGDGTFGIVFQVYNTAGKLYAAKLMYEHQSESNSKKRFELEMASAQKIRSKLRNHDDFSGVIEIEGGSTSFHSSSVYQEKLKHDKDFMQLGISNYVIVMPKYQKTLKQLLEEEKENCYSFLLRNNVVKKYFPNAPIASNEVLTELIKDRIDSTEVKEEIRKSIYKVNGYEVLKRMSFRERVNTTLPYIVSVAQGLKTLHSAQLLHLDLKPANIFVRNDGQNIETVVGDLGFLDESFGEATYNDLLGEQENTADSNYLNFPENPHYGTVGRPSLPLGTRHYRSPEQKDFFDVADVEVSVGEHVRLTVNDPKFRDAIVEDLDVVLFSKIKEPFEISDVDISNSSEQQPSVIITLNVPDEKLSLIKEDERTQVFFYKRQRHRTDLFGFGALIFELLSCGKSPERFYESIRRYDDKGGNINSIMDLYKQVSNFRNTEPGLVQMFEVFRLDNNSLEYAPEEIVELILKCMMYKASGIFYSKEHEDKQPGSTMQRVLDYINLLYTGKAKSYEEYRICATNPLYSGNIVQESEAEYGNFWDYLQETQGLLEEKFPERLAVGLWHLEKIIDLIRGSLSGEDEMFFLELTPQNINTDFKQRKSTARYSIYRDEDSYLADLAGDLVRTKLIDDLTNPFVPSYLAFMRRKIMLCKSPKFLAAAKQSMPSTNGEAKVEFDSYRFLTSSLYGDDINSGDWIVVRGTNHLLLNVLRCQNTKLQLKLHPFDNVLSNVLEIDNTSELSAIYYKKLDRCIYYLHMIGIYIYHLFFVNLTNNNYNKPRIENYIRSFGIDAVKSLQIKEVESFKSANSSDGNLLSSMLKSRKIVDPKAEGREKLHIILKKLAQIYLKLILTENKDSYYSSNKKEESEIFISVSQDVSDLRIDIANLLECRPVELDYIGIQGIGKFAFPKLSEKVLTTSKNDMSKLFNFDTLVENLIINPPSPGYSPGVF